MLMKDSLGGKSKTLMFVNLSPASYNLDESLQSLYYASIAKKIVNKTKKNYESEEISKIKGKYREVMDKYDKLKLKFASKGHSLIDNKITPLKRKYLRK